MGVGSGQAREFGGSPGARRIGECGLSDARAARTASGANSAAARSRRWRFVAIAALAACAGLFGYGWAALRADARMGDRLPAEWEGRDVMVVGVVAGLPASTDDGVRFAFDVEHAYAAQAGCALTRAEPGAPAASGVRQAHGRFACESVPVPRRIELSWAAQSRFGTGSGGGRGSGGSGDSRGEENEAAAPRAGERWRLPVRLKIPRGVANWGGADAELTALVKGVRATGYVRTPFRAPHASRATHTSRARHASASRRLDAGPVPGYRFAAWRAQLRDDFRAALGPAARYGGVLMALALGERGDIAADDWQVFADTGVSHLLAISGLHVSLVAGAFGALAGGLWRRVCGPRFSLPLWWPAPKAAAVAGLLAAIAYGAVAGWGVPVRRAVMMVALVVFALVHGRMAAPSYVLAWALAAVVALEPWAVVTPGLWLSFGAVAALLLGARRSEVLRPRRMASECDVRESGATRAPGRAVETCPRPTRDALHGWLRRVARMPVRVARALFPKIRQAARAQYIVTIGMVPLSLAWFGAVPLLGPLANAVAIPVMTLIVTPLALASLLLPATPAHWALTLAHAVVAWLAEWLGALAAMPWAVWRAAMAPSWAQGLAVAGVVACLAPLPWPTGWPRGERLATRLGTRVAIRVAIRAAGLAMMGPVLFASHPRPAPGAFRLTMLDIGQGNAVLVETTTRTLLFDTGPPFGRHSDAGRRVIVPYLRAHGIARLDRLVVSHAHDDHFGGARSVLHAYPAAHMMSSLPQGHRVRGAAAAHRTCLAGQRWTWDGVAFEFLHPDPATLREGRAGSTGPNSVSCVLRVSNGQRSALLAADAEAPQEGAMLARFGPRLRSEVLLAPHHGSLTSSTPAFVAAVAPQHVVFQTGYRNRFAHPRPQVVARYREAGSRVWQSVTHGAVRFSMNANGIDVEAYRQVRRRYWHAEIATM
ncbi:DNA internalization-related competence protein ComEC/Rec2 [Pandoraea nosoerga]|nr:DNA internalization-related competence protein ComEC/Rec2 [Pandoraea nosoerga]MBN4680659.1 DNA internalization-related competence protein ComEC/Rec2 [Pandoraea nosoerga]